MKTKLLKSAIIVMAMVSFSNAEKVDILLGAGYGVSSGYVEYGDEAYTIGVESPFFGWLELYLGLEYMLTPQVSIIGGADLWLTEIEESYLVNNETYFETIIIPSVYVQYYFTESRSFYVNGGIGVPIPNTGRENAEFSSNGISLGGNVGYAFGKGLFRLEAGYTFVPVKVEITGGSAGSGEYNFGGPKLRMMLAF